MPKRSQVSMDLYATNLRNRWIDRAGCSSSQKYFNLCKCSGRKGQPQTLQSFQGSLGCSWGGLEWCNVKDPTAFVLLKFLNKFVSFIEWQENTCCEIESPIFISRPSLHSFCPRIGSADGLLSALRWILPAILGHGVLAQGGASPSQSRWGCEWGACFPIKRWMERSSDPKNSKKNCSNWASKQYVLKPWVFLMKMTRIQPAKCSGIRWDQEMGSIHSFWVSIFAS